MNYERKHLILSMVIFLIMAIPISILIAMNFSGVVNFVISVLTGVILMSLTIFIVNRII